MRRTQHRRATEIRAEPDRYAGPRRFSLRSFAQPGLLRRGGAAGRCLSGGRGPDRGQRLAAMEHNLTIVPVLNKVDLKHARPDEVIAEMEPVLGIDPDEVLRMQRQDGRRRRGAAGGDRRAHSAADGRSRRAAAGDGVRLALRRISRRDHLRAADERHGREGAEDPLPQSRRHARSARAGPVRARAQAVRRTAGRRRSAI